jgi:hypothetical protein
MPLLCEEVSRFEIKVPDDCREVIQAVSKL